MSKHHLTVEDGRITKFVCEDEQGECHTYPACDCESWSRDMHDAEFGKGHEYVHHKDCWMKGWFDTPESTSYNGEDACGGEVPPSLTRSGYIDTDWEECVIWNFTEGMTP